MSDIVDLCLMRARCALLPHPHGKGALILFDDASCRPRPRTGRDLIVPGFLPYNLGYPLINVLRNLPQGSMQIIEP